MIWYIIVTIIFLLIVYYVLYKKNNIHFVSKRDKKEILYILNNANYFERFNEIDYKVRNCINKKDCILKYCDNIEDFSSTEKNYLIDLCKKLNNRLKNYKRLCKIPWKFCKLSDLIENGYPHTNSNIIFLSNRFLKNRDEIENMVTLLHEKIHIYQRLNVRETKKFYKIHGFESIDCDCKIKHRTNPDDLKTEHYKFNGTLVRSEYLDYAKSLSDIILLFDNSENDKTGEKILTELKSEYGIQIESINEIFASIISLYIIKNIKFEKYLSDFEITISKYLNN
jgi:hypothetical protein